MCGPIGSSEHSFVVCWYLSSGPAEDGVDDEWMEMSNNSEIEVTATVVGLDDGADHDPVGPAEDRGAETQVTLVCAEQDLVVGAAAGRESGTSAPVDAH